MSRFRRRPRLRLRSLRLRTRITLSFAIGAAVLSLLIAGVTFGLTRANLMKQREAAALSQTYTNAKILQPQLAQTNLSYSDLQNDLNSLETPTGSRPVVRAVGANNQAQWAQVNTSFGENAIPLAVRRAVVESGKAVKMRYVFGGQTELVIGLPIPSARASYFEIVSLQEVQSTLNSLATVLLVAAAISVLAGTALGAWISRRMLRPFADVGLASEAIAGGHFSTRLDAGDDPDLRVLVTSFNHMASALEARVGRDARFASDVSHELRSPLMTLAASMEVLESRRDDLPEGPLRSALDLMSADLRRFSQLVEDLLEISRYDAGAVRLELDEVRLPELVLQAVTFHTRSDVPVELDAELAGLIVRADKRRLVRVIANLLDNAAKYGGGATRVVLRRVDDRVQIIVEDNGTGVPEEERELVFDRFSRGAGAGRRSAGSEGVGLGLSLVTEHVALQGGRVWIEDRPDGESGARFVVELPVATP